MYIFAVLKLLSGQSDLNFEQLMCQRVNAFRYIYCTRCMLILSKFKRSTDVGGRGGPKVYKNVQGEDWPNWACVIIGRALFPPKISQNGVQEVSAVFEHSTFQIVRLYLKNKLSPDMVYPLYFIGSWNNCLLKSLNDIFTLYKFFEA